METETILKKIVADLKEIKVSLNEIDEDFHRGVRPEYIEKLKRISKQEGRRFKTKEELLKFLNHGI